MRIGIFSSEDNIPYGLKSNAAYRFTCTVFNASYELKPAETFLSGPINIGKQIKSAILANTSIKICNINNFVMVTV